jgi:hypothetical protein
MNRDWGLRAAAATPPFGFFSPNMKVLIVIVALMAACSSLPRSQDNRRTPVSAHTEFQLNIPNDPWEPLFFEAIDERAKLSNLKTLRSGALPNDDLEVRVWHGFGLTALEGFVFKRTAGDWSAIHLDGITRKVASPESQKNLAAPKSGWETFWQRLQDAGILTLPDAATIQCSAMVNDGMGYVVEYNRNGIYRTYMYDNPNFAKCDEAKRMIAIGNLISAEFGIPEMATK